ncbi:hypothetical protein [Streptomyces sp. NPDC097619]|uniref:SCO6745 family protein n=1 Tax=Streptomyces sp. NPDC097619 TaxID=3157228 RepID=UPI003333C608
MTTTLPALAVRNCAQGTLNPMHAILYFAPEHTSEITAAGIKDPQGAALAARAAALGAVGPGAVAAAFFNYDHGLLARHFPAVWREASPEVVLEARTRAADTTLRRLLGEEVIASAEMAEAAELALRATEACTRHGRILYSAHADLPVPEEPHLAYWHAATLLREHRGDGHIIALVAAELDPIESLVSHTASGLGMTPKWTKLTRGWTQEQLDAAKDRLRARGVLDAEGELTPAGLDLREEVERETDRLDRAPYEHLGAAGTARLTELGQGWFMKALGNGAFPRDLLGKG